MKPQWNREDDVVDDVVDAEEEEEEEEEADEAIAAEVCRCSRTHPA